VNLFTAFLATLRRALPPQARDRLAGAEVFLAALRALPKTTIVVVLLTGAVIYALKAVFTIVLLLLLAAYWLLETTLKSPGARPCPSPTPALSLTPTSPRTP